MLTDTPALRHVKRTKRAGGEQRTHWSDRDKIETVKTYLALGGSRALTASTMKIPLPTVNEWMRTEWWHTLESEIKKEERLTFSTSMKKLIDKAMIQIEDRLDKGDWIYDNRSGEFKRKPVAMRDIHRVAVDMLDKRIKIEDKENYTVAQENIQDKLSQLAKSFAELSSKKPVLVAQDIDFTVEEGEVEHAVDGLQEVPREQT